MSWTSRRATVVFVAGTVRMRLRHSVASEPTLEDSLRVVAPRVQPGERCRKPRLVHSRWSFAEGGALTVKTSPLRIYN